MTDDQDLVQAINNLCDEIAGAAAGDRAQLFTEFFTLERTEEVAAQWAENEFRFEVVLNRLATVRGLGTRVRALTQSIRRAQRRSQ